MNYKEMTINDRFKYLRKKILNKTQLELANVLDMTHAGISKIESEKTGLTEKNIKIICKEFNVNYAWLVYGEGEIFNTIQKTLIDRLSDEYELNDIQRRIIEAVLELNDEQINAFTLKFFGFEAIKKDHQS